MGNKPAEGPGTAGVLSTNPNTSMVNSQQAPTVSLPTERNNLDQFPNSLFSANEKSRSPRGEQGMHT